MRFQRVAAAWLTAFVLLAGVTLSGQVLAQSQPRAAPVGEAAQSQELGPTAAPTTDVSINQTGGTMGPDIGGISVMSLFLHADPLVKGVFALLVLASLWSWTIIINQALVLRRLHRRGDKFEKIFWSGLSLEELYQQFSQRTDHPMAAVFVSALREWRRAFENGTPRESRLVSIRDRIDKAMSVTALREMDGLERQLGFLATVGSVSPFIGLFGTVWGIMNSFSAIAARHDTTLAVVAPGIAEALFATAMGLLAAIPAVIFYNRFVNEMARYNNRLNGFADEFSAILSRQLDEKVH
jgi:biopolymer transport protein TolQ